jgi:hypothetical protein
LALAKLKGKTLELIGTPAETSSSANAAIFKSLIGTD